MSWLARSLADSLRIDDGEEGDENHSIPKNSQSERKENEQEDEEEEEEEEDRAGRGVREDLSELTESLSRQLRGVASFLAPPPPPPPPSRDRVDKSVADGDLWERSDRSGSDEEFSVSVGISGNYNGVEDRFRTGISNQSSNQVVSETMKMDSNLLPFELDDPIGSAVGITEEVMAFALNIAHHPETWLDFPLEEEEDIDDFVMSDAQREHVLAIQRLASRLAALRIELCPVHMSEAYFWNVYFVLLHSRLSKQDAELLSTPQIMAARAMWMQELQKRTKAETDWFGRDNSHVKESVNAWQGSFGNTLSDDSPENKSPRTFAFEPATSSMTTELETEKHPVISSEMQIVDKSVIKEDPVMKTEYKDIVAGPPFKLTFQNYEEEEDDDDWLKEDSELDGYNTTAILIGDDEDVSFSDLEDNDDYTTAIKSKKVTTGLDSPTKTK